MEKFYFFNSFLETARAIEDEVLRGKYLMAVAEYGIEGKEPDDPIIKPMMVQTQFVIDRSKEISQQKSEKMKGNQNAVKNFEKVSKQRKTDKNGDKQKKQEEEVEVEEEYIKKEVEEKKQPQPPQEEKINYGENVRLTKTEYDKLVNKYGSKMVNRYITQLDYYILEKGKEYKSHYLTLNKWMIKDDIPEVKKSPPLPDFQIEDGVYDLEKMDAFYGT